MTLKMVKNVENYTKIFDFLTKMANFRTFIKCQKCTGIFEIFGRLFSQKFRVFIETIETVNGTQYPTCTTLICRSIIRMVFINCWKSKSHKSRLCA